MSDKNKTLILDEDGQKTLIAGVETIASDVKSVKSKQETILSDISRLDGETKKALEALTIAKNTANSAKDFEVALSKMQLQLRREQRMAFGDPIKRIQSDDELRTRFNLAVRMGVSKVIDCQKAIEILQKDLATGSTPGSTLITTHLANEIYDTLLTYGIWNTFRVVRAGTKTTTFPVKTARIAASFIDEAGQISADSTKAGTSVSLIMKKIAALILVSRELLQDAEFDVTSDVLSDLAEATAYKLDWACTQADGTADSTDGSLTGVFGGGGTAATAAAGNVTVEATQLPDWQNCLLTVDAAVLQRMAKWWMHPQILVRTLAIRDNNGRPLFQTALEVPSPKAIGSILGYPVILGGVCPTTNAASAKVAVFGDPDGQVVGVRQDLEIATSAEFKFDYDQVAFRSIMRAGTKIRAATSFAVLTLPAA